MAFERLQCNGEGVAEALTRVLTKHGESGALGEDVMGRFRGDAAETTPRLVRAMKPMVEVYGGIELIASCIQLDDRGVRGARSEVRIWRGWMRVI